MVWLAVCYFTATSRVGEGGVVCGNSVSIALHNLMAQVERAGGGEVAFLPPELLILLGTLEKYKHLYDISLEVVNLLSSSAVLFARTFL